MALSNTTIIHGGITINKAILQISPLTKHNKGPEYAEKAAQKLLNAADLLGVNEFIGLELASFGDRYIISFLSNADVKLETEDINWLMNECAKTEIISRGELDDLFDDQSRVYAFYSLPVEYVNSGETDSGRSDEYFSQLSDLFLNTNGVIRLIIERRYAEKAPVITMMASLHNNVSFRLKNMISAAIPGMMIREVSGCSYDYEQCTCSRKTSIELLEKTFTKLMGMEWAVYEKRMIEEDVDSLRNIVIQKANEIVLPRDDLDDNSDIEELELSVRSYNCLKRASINTLGDLRSLSDYELRKIRNMRRNCYVEIKAILVRLDKNCNHVNRASRVEETDTKKPHENDHSPHEDMTESAKPIADNMSKLDGLIGLDAVKEQVKKIVAFAKMQQDMKSRGIKSDPIVLNMEFTGNPGTAKTTVARIMAGILHEAGLLSSNEIVETGRSDLVGVYTGQTADKVKSVFSIAEGRLLFIDEAYSLLDLHENSFGDEAINTIVQEIENKRDKTIVVFAGYPDKMRDFFKRNPGLRSRVPFSINFSDYAADEMAQIAELEAKKRGFKLNDSARRKLLTACKAAAGDPEKGNGRFCRNLIEKSILDYAARVYGNDSKDSDKDFILRGEDVNTSCIRTKYKGNTSSPKRSQIGFVV